MGKRSHEPVFWSLFGAGGVIAALALPALVLVTGVLWPLGLMPGDALGHGRVSAVAGSFVGGLALFGVVALVLWHAAHRIYHSLHDFGVQRGLRVWKVVCYGAALLGTLWAGAVVASLML